jgi:hypothetical protein
MRARGWAAAIAVGLMVLAGCGDQDSSGAADPPPTGASTPSTTGSATGSPTGQPPTSEPTHGAEPCPYLTEEQVSAAIGAETTETAGSLHACFFDPVGGTGPSVMLSRVDVQIDPTDYAIQSRALCQGDVTDVEAGNEAFACVMGMGPQGQVYAGRVLVTVNVNDAADDAAGIAAAAELLPEVTVPPAG